MAVPCRSYKADEKSHGHARSQNYGGVELLQEIEIVVVNGVVELKLHGKFGNVTAKGQNRSR